MSNDNNNAVPNAAVAGGAAGCANGIEAAMANALRRISYPDYKPKEDFPLWLQGFREKVRTAFGLNQTQNDEVNAEVLKAISGKLACGTALDTYNRLSEVEKNQLQPDGAEAN